MLQYSPLTKVVLVQLSSLQKGLLLSALNFTSATDLTNVEVGNANTNKSLANDSSSTKVEISELSIGFFTKGLENIATLSATNAAGMARLQLAEDHARLTKANLEAANSRIMDVDVAEESTRFAKYNILTQASAAMLSQANQSSATASTTTLIFRIMKRSEQNPKFNQVFDTCLKSDKQHEVAGQKTNHGGYIPCH